MEEKKVMSHFVAGLLIGLILIVFSIAGYLTDMYQQNWYNWAVNIILCIAIIVACITYANQKDNYVTFGNVFSHGFKTTAIIAIIVLVYTVLTMGVLFPEMKEKALELAQKRMEEKGNLTDDQIEKGMEFTKKYFMAFVIFGVMIGTLLFGVVASLIGAAIAKKKPVNPMDQLN